jgi:putative ABC transport system substrate-binding protein
MTRREFVALLSGVAAWPLPLSVQQAARPVIGFLGSGSPGEFADLLMLAEYGDKAHEGGDVTIFCETQ